MVSYKEETRINVKFDNSNEKNKGTKRINQTDNNITENFRILTLQVEL